MGFHCLGGSPVEGRCRGVLRFLFIFFLSGLRGIAPRGVLDIRLVWFSTVDVWGSGATRFAFFLPTTSLRVRTTGAEAVPDGTTPAPAPAPGTTGDPGSDTPPFPPSPSFLGSVAPSSSGHTATAQRTTSRGFGSAPSGNSIGPLPFFPRGKNPVSPLPFFLGRGGTGGRGILGRALRLRVSSFFQD